jgi:hypothetical protein
MLVRNGVYNSVASDLVGDSLSHPQLQAGSKKMNINPRFFNP